MRISIRPDYCIALRMIAIQEFHRKAQDFIKELQLDGSIFYVDEFFMEEEEE